MDNAQAKAYAKLAMIKAGIDEETIRKVLREMIWQFALLTPDEAERRANEGRPA